VRAGRLLTILLTLQDEGRSTTSALAGRLEVSRRTVLRDIAALSEAGIPIVTYAGPGGGVELLDGWRSTVPGVASQTLLLRALGATGEWLVIDPEPAPGYAVAPDLLRQAGAACQGHLELEVSVAGSVRVLRPTRLVLRAGRWWLDDALPLDTIESHQLGEPVAV
jgi:predicted DNA-binding transcriptional regulator YafY